MAYPNLLLYRAKGLVVEHGECCIPTYFSKDRGNKKCHSFLRQLDCKLRYCQRHPAFSEHYILR